MKTKKILLILAYFIFLFLFIIYLRNDSKTMQEKWNERSFEEIYGSPQKIFEEVGTEIHRPRMTNFTFNISEEIK